MEIESLNLGYLAVGLVFCKIQRLLKMEIERSLLLQLITQHITRKIQRLLKMEIERVKADVGEDCWAK